MNIPAKTPQGYCLFCGSADLSVCDSFAGLARVTSDCRPWPTGGTLARCQSCHLVQSIISDYWREEVARIYRGYAIYHQADGAEQQVFVKGGDRPSSRSEVIVGKLKALNILPAEGRLLDFGCGNGAFIRACSNQLDQWSFYGAELSRTHEQTVRAIRGVKDFFTCPIQKMPGQYDLISLVHVLEHIPDFNSFMQHVQARLKPGGLLLVEVPNCLVNPFMLLVADHCSHNSPSVLANLLAKSGFKIRQVTDQWIPKEITIIGQKPSLAEKPENYAAIPEESQRIIASVGWLNTLVQRVKAIVDRGSFGLFGTSIAATWLDAQTGNKARFFVDEDPGRQGRRHFERPIIAPKDIPADSVVFIALPRSLASQIAARIQRPNVEVLIPDP